VVAVVSWVLICHGLATAGVPSAPELEGQYLESFDVEAHDGRGTATWTLDVGSAMKFEDLVSAIEAWQTQSRLRPLREDGRPNRPLTAFSVEPKVIP
jgi:hypothetical protein